MVDLPSKNGKKNGDFPLFFLHVYQAGYHHGPQENIIILFPSKMATGKFAGWSAWSMLIQKLRHDAISVCFKSSWSGLMSKILSGILMFEIPIFCLLDDEKLTLFDM